MGLLKHAEKIRKKRWKEYRKHLRKKKRSEYISKLKILPKKFLVHLKRILLIIDISLLIIIFSFIFSLVLVGQGIIDKDKYIESIMYIMEFFK